MKVYVMPALTAAFLLGLATAVGLGFTGQADATTLKASPSLTILAQNSETPKFRTCSTHSPTMASPVAPPKRHQATSQRPVDKCRPNLKAVAARRTRSTRKRASTRGGRRDGLDCLGGMIACRRFI